MNTQPTPEDVEAHKSDTPRTDGHAEKMNAARVPNARSWPYWYDFAQTLERALNASQAEVERLRAELEKSEARTKNG